MRDVNKHRHASATCPVPRLPPLSINKLTQGQLKAFVPGLMQLATGNAGSTDKDMTKAADWLLLNSTQSKSKENITTDVLRAMVRNCYRRLGQEDLLSCNSDASWKSALARLTELQSSNYYNKVPQNCGSMEYLPSIMSNQGYMKSFIEIFVCYFCSEEFGAKEDLRLHQAGCSLRPPELQAIQSATVPAAPAADCNAACPQLIPQGMVFEEKVVTQPKDEYLEGLDLVPVLKAKKIRERRRVTEVELDVETFIEPETPRSPATPRTPKSLISQLSRDGGESSSCKRRLSYLFPRDNSDAESVISNNSSDEHDEHHKPSKTLSLLFIDIASPLGQKVQHYMTADEVSSKVLSDPESFCKTPVKDTTFSEKLRARNNIVQITYKLTRKRLKQFNHIYHFNKSQRLDRYDRLRTGLNRGSRIMKKSLPKCRLEIQRLTPNDFKKWKASMDPPTVPLNWKALSRKAALKKLSHQILKQPCSFPRGPVLLSPGIDKLLGLRTKESRATKRTSLTLTNVVSEDTNAEMAQIKLSLYKCLLTELSDRSQKNDANFLNTSPIKDHQRMNDSPVFLSPCSVKIQPLQKPSPRSSPSKKHSKVSPTGPLKIEIPTSEHFNSFLSSRKCSSTGEDLLRDIDCLGSDESISVRTVSSDESFSGISPNEDSCVKCRNIVCSCNIKKEKNIDSKQSNISIDKKGDSKPIKRKVGRPLKDRNSDTNIRKKPVTPPRSVGRPSKKMISTTKPVLSTSKNRNLTRSRGDCSRQIIRKYRKELTSNLLRKLQIDMVEYNFTPSNMTSTEDVIPKGMAKKLHIDMVWDPNNTKTGRGEYKKVLKSSASGDLLQVKSKKTNTVKRVPKSPSSDSEVSFKKITDSADSSTTTTKSKSLFISKDADISQKNCEKKVLKNENQKTQTSEMSKKKLMHQKTASVPKGLQIDMVWDFKDPKTRHEGGGSMQSSLLKRSNSISSSQSVKAPSSKETTQRKQPGAISSPLKTYALKRSHSQTSKASPLKDSKKTNNMAEIQKKSVKVSPLKKSNFSKSASETNVSSRGATQKKSSSPASTPKKSPLLKKSSSISSCKASQLTPLKENKTASTVSSPLKTSPVKRSNLVSSCKSPKACPSCDSPARKTNSPSPSKKTCGTPVITKFFPKQKSLPASPSPPKSLNNPKLTKSSSSPIKTQQVNPKKKSSSATGTLSKSNAKSPQKQLVKNSPKKQLVKNSPKKQYSLTKSKSSPSKISSDKPNRPKPSVSAGHLLAGAKRKLSVGSICAPKPKKQKL
ncbi:uncharacterized protein LOC126827722 isoform X2 [Patella vulgata]|nr:uncharacterized protein LOC126827722 isoform X2 [Patella vulgata]